MAREAGLRLTTHAGEWRGPREVEDAITDLRVERIGHGVRAYEDLALVDKLVAFLLAVFLRGTDGGFQLVTGRPRRSVAHLGF